MDLLEEELDAEARLSRILEELIHQEARILDRLRRDERRERLGAGVERVLVGRDRVVALLIRREAANRRVLVEQVQYVEHQLEAASAVQAERMLQLHVGLRVHRRAAVA